MIIGALLFFPVGLLILMLAPFVEIVIDNLNEEDKENVNSK
ncbi:hypothetical protein Javan174_0058 [Streptococcus phage Javan174]|nr:hypothetical protein Javan174_0058 [Streptococcus phage Javan174]